MSACRPIMSGPCGPSTPVSVSLQRDVAVTGNIKLTLFNKMKLRSIASPGPKAILGSNFILWLAIYYCCVQTFDGCNYFTFRTILRATYKLGCNNFICKFFIILQMRRKLYKYCFYCQISLSQSLEGNTVKPLSTLHCYTNITKLL